MKILFLARHFSYLRLFESAIAELAERGHAVHLSADREESLGGAAMVERLAARYPQVSYAIAAGDQKCGEPDDDSRDPVIEVAYAGPWKHTEAPPRMPGWMPCGEFASLISFREGNEARLAARGIAWVSGAREPRADPRCP